MYKDILVDSTFKMLLRIVIKFINFKETRVKSIILEN